MTASQGLSRIGLVALAVMGQNLALNIAEKGFLISVYNLSSAKVDEPRRRAICRCAGSTIRVKSIQKPRSVIILVKALGRTARGQHHRPPVAALGDWRLHHRWRQTSVTRIRSGERRPRRSTGVVPWHGSEWRGRRLAPWPRAHAGWDRGGVRLRLQHRHAGRRAGERRPVRDLRRPLRRLQLRQDGAQWHRVRRHGAHRGGLRCAQVRRGVVQSGSFHVP